MNQPSRTPPSDRRSSMLWLWIGLGVVIVGVGVVAVMVGRSSSSSSDAADYGEAVTVEGTALPSGTGGTSDDPAIGQTLPTITGTTVDGDPITIGPDGKPQVIMVVAHWCPHCQAEVPRIKEWLDDNGMPDDVELVAVATSNDPSSGQPPAPEWLDDAGWTVPTLYDDDSNHAGEALGTSSFPYFIVVDAEGKVVFRGTGELTMDQVEMLIDAARTGSAPAGT